MSSHHSCEVSDTFFFTLDLSSINSKRSWQSSEQRRAASDQDQSSMLKVICNQRDRFRARLRETEEVS